jgi:hypothetical protein
MIMSITCDVIVDWKATPGQLNALIAGRLPDSRQAGQEGVHLLVRDEVSLDRRATIDSLRPGMPAAGLVDIMVDGTSWNLAA